MTERDIYNPGSELDHRLEKVMESHQPAAKTSSTPAVEQESGLQAFVQRASISEELAAIDSSKFATDLNVVRASEHIDHIIEEKSERFDSFLDTLKTASSEITVVDPVKTAQELIRQGVDPREAARRALA
jgi:hypothetical protein